MSIEHTQELDIEMIKDKFQEAFLNVWFGKVENDSFNRWVIQANVSWREVRVLRAYAKYLRQTDFNYSQPYIESCFNKYPQIARMLIELFLLRFDPKTTKKTRKKLKQLIISSKLSLKKYQLSMKTRLFVRSIN